jgi:hypothetical protein
MAIGESFCSFEGLGLHDRSDIDEIKRTKNKRRRVRGHYLLIYQPTRQETKDEQVEEHKTKTRTILSLYQTWVKEKKD